MLRYILGLVLVIVGFIMLGENGLAAYPVFVTLAGFALLSIRERKP